ncbi:hypothetical protein [Olivibacter sitiensis]|uniref:hypothetical protein n=1 Tax=Olivibacter sitiensis TaxID=376470 RepID=UPI000400DB37|nr:hypothetical protein [Olivibacter sitiensis]
MRVKKLIKVFIWLAVLAIPIFVLVLYATIKTKSTPIDKYQPYKAWVGKTVRLNRETTLFKENLTLNSCYPFLLLDSLHPRWRYAESQLSHPEPDLVRIKTFPKGTELTFEKAVQYTNGVSGFSSPMLFGVIKDGGKVYKLGYQWGSQSISRDFDGIKESWQFHQAPWQEVKDTAYYALPVAKWW